MNNTATASNLLALSKYPYGSWPDQVASPSEIELLNLPKAVDSATMVREPYSVIDSAQRRWAAHSALNIKLITNAGKYGFAERFSKPRGELGELGARLIPVIGTNRINGVQPKRVGDNLPQLSKIGQLAATHRLHQQVSDCGGLHGASDDRSPYSCSGEFVE